MDRMLAFRISPRESNSLPISSENLPFTLKTIKSTSFSHCQEGDLAVKAVVVSLNMSSSLDQIYQAVWVPHAGDRPVFPPFLERFLIRRGCRPNRWVLPAVPGMGCMSTPACLDVYPCLTQQEVEEHLPTTLSVNGFIRISLSWVPREETNS